MRGFMVFPPDKIGVYLDWRTQEIGVAAALSEDPALMDDYSNGDVYYALANHVRPDRRSRRQALEGEQQADAPAHEVAAARHQLRHGRAVAGARSRSASADRQHHHRTAQAHLSAVLGVAGERANTAMLDREMETQFGWPLYLSHTPNQRTIYNFPMQGNGAEMLRLAATRTVRGRHHPEHAGARRHPA